MQDKSSSICSNMTTAGLKFSDLALGDLTLFLRGGDEGCHFIGRKDRADEQIPRRAQKLSHLLAVVVQGEAGADGTIAATAIRAGGTAVGRARTGG